MNSLSDKVKINLKEDFNHYFHNFMKKIINYMLLMKLLLNNEMKLEVKYFYLYK